MPKPLSKRVLVRHVTTGAKKEVLRSQLRSLGRHWERVPVAERAKKRVRRASRGRSSQKPPTDPATTADKED